jgi:hypothetical protein
MSQEEQVNRYNEAFARTEISTKEGLKAVAVIAKLAAEEGIEWALAGGIAMHVYGYQRATKDVDLLASSVLSLPRDQKLSFGGESYLVQVGERTITVDVIVRDDFFRDFYDAALRDARTMPDGMRVIVPEWMVILKYLSGRSKDILDLLWMLREPGLVDRTEVSKLLEQVMGESGAQVALRGLEPYYVQAEVMRAGDENGRQER